MNESSFIDVGTNNKFFVIASTGSPELEHLAKSLDDYGLLNRYMIPHAGDHSFLKRMPFFNNISLKSSNLPSHTVSGAPVLQLIRVLLRYRFKSIDRKLIAFRNLMMRRRVAKLVIPGTVLIASSEIAETAFNKAKDCNAVSILNLPSVHPTYRLNQLSIECNLQPKLKASMEADWPVSDAIEVMERELLLADLILVGSSFSQRTIEEYSSTKSRIVVAPYGVEAHYHSIHPKLQQTESYNLVFVGRLSQAKGLSYLLDAYRSVCKSNWNLDIIGPGDSSLFSNSSDHTNGIRFIGGLPHAEVIRRLPNYSVLVMPSLFEGLGYVNLEAMASGLPVIATTCGPDQVVVDGVNGILVPPRDIESLSKAMVELERTDKRNLLRTGALETAHLHSWSHYFNTILTAIYGDHE